MTHSLKTFALVAVALLFVACEKTPVSTAQTNNPEFSVEKLFTHEGCTVFRFYDTGNVHYYVTCDFPTHASALNTHDCGQNCKFEDSISTRPWLLP